MLGDENMFSQTDLFADDNNYESNEINLNVTDFNDQSFESQEQFFENKEQSDEQKIFEQQQAMVSDLVSVTEKKMIYRVLLLLRKAKEENATWEDLEASILGLLNE